MEISKLKTLTTPNINDVLPILDINGGVSGKPILRKISLQNIFSLIDLSSNGGSASGFTVPNTIKAIAQSGDFFIGIDLTGTPYKITKSDLLAGLSSGSSAGSSGTENGSSGTSDSYFSDVVFLSHFNSLIDIKGKTITAVGDAMISTVTPKFIGGGSAVFDGTGDSFQLPTSGDFDFSDGSDFTIELFFNLSAFPSSVGALLSRFVSSSDDSFNLDISTTNIRITGWYTVYINAVHGISLNTWNYVAVTRQGNNLKLFINGTLVGSYTGATNFPNTNNFLIGGASVAGRNIIGKVAEMRITRRARVINSVPPTQFPDN
jgi:hypothetical protein